MLSEGEQSENVQVSPDGKTAWVHASDGSTVGRFSMIFGMDVHTTVTSQLAGEAQCLHCTHQAPSVDDWQLFCDLMAKHYKIEVDQSLMRF